MPSTNSPTSGRPADRQGRSRDGATSQRRLLVKDLATLRRLVRHYRRAAVLTFLAGEIKAGVTLAITDQGNVAWWANLGWAVVLLVGWGYLAAPRLRRLAELTDPASIRR
jgi:hypothetical protein